MKKFFLLLSLMLVVASVSTFARSTNTESEAEKTFKQQFAGAENVKWSKEGDYLKVFFTWADHQTIAYFNSDAKLVGCVRGLVFHQLPLLVMRSVEKQFNNPVVIETREITNEEGLYYIVLLEQQDKKYKIRLNSLGEVQEKERIKK